MSVFGIFCPVFWDFLYGILEVNFSFQYKSIDIFANTFIHHLNRYLKTRGNIPQNLYVGEWSNTVLQNVMDLKKNQLKDLGKDID